MRIVRLTVETNIVTSKGFRVIDVMDVLPSSHAHLATVSIVSLLMVAMYPVSGLECPVHFSADIDASTRNSGEELVCVPVRIQFHFLTHNFISRYII